MSSDSVLAVILLPIALLLYVIGFALVKAKSVPRIKFALRAFGINMRLEIDDEAVISDRKE
jgi:hypothetical protein